ncbi:MAG TPA: alanine racemase, partial [bacterium]|nr:alanine racemase [bacterium]
MRTLPANLFKTWAEIDLGAIAGNIRAVRERCGAGVKILVGVKADAYGHGVFPVARTAIKAGAVDYLAKPADADG